jgi:branched-subunit amino acid ABC-type transport system permease component
MPDPILYLMLSLGTGAVYALLANGVVAIYKGSGVLNFAQGAIAMMGAYVYLALIEDGLSKYAALAITLIGSAAAGAFLATAIFRQLRTAPALAKVVATLGLLVLLQGIAYVVWGPSAKIVPSILPTHGVRVSGAFVGVDRFYMAGIAVGLAVVLGAAYRFTKLGLATQATSQNERGASLLGFSPTQISAVNWALGSVLASLAGILITPIASLDNGQLPLFVLPALAAALVGRFSSFSVTTAAAFAIGWIQIWVFYKWTQPGVQTAAPFVIVILVMVVAGRALPTRGAVSEGRPPLAPRGAVRWIPMAFCLLAGLVAVNVLSTLYQSALVTSFIMVVLALSLVVLTGYVGQISLMQMTFAGLGGFIAAKFATTMHVPFPFPILIGAILVVPLGIVLGLPALRVRGLSLAVVTLGAAIAFDSVLFQNQGWTKGIDGIAMPQPRLFGWSLDPFDHPDRYGGFVLICALLVAYVVGNIRRSGLGRRMLAVRSNERAASVAGVNVPAVKLQAFAISAAIAAFGGGLLAYSNPFIVFGNGGFAAGPSISLLTVAYIGGIASIGGAAVAGIGAAGGVIYVLMAKINGFDKYYLLITGVALVWTVLVHPDGVAPFFGEKIRRLASKLTRRADRPSVSEPPPTLAEPAREPARLP